MATSRPLHLLQFSSITPCEKWPLETENSTSGAVHSQIKLLGIEGSKWGGLRHGTKKVKKPPPEGLTKAEAKIFLKYRNRAYLLDKCILGSFGASTVIGLIPVAGDGIDVLMALSILQTAKKAFKEQGIEFKDKDWRKMRGNVILDFTVRLFPVLGDIWDAFYKCNTRNVRIMENRLIKIGKVRLGEIEPSQHDHSSDSDDEYRPEMRQTGGAAASRKSTSRREKALPAPARESTHRDDEYRRSKKGRGPEPHNGSRREHDSQVPSRQGSRLQRRERRQY
ncbi:MAG: hypothetical protein Q9227_008414 [Pyrenula ochraceoflavens]